MPHNRTLKHEFFTDLRVGKLQFGDRLLFAGLWTLADRDGRLKEQPGEFLRKLMPYNPDYDISDALVRLHDANLITRYQIHGEFHIQIRNWLKHQNPHHTEVSRNIPAPEGYVPYKKPENYGEFQNPNSRVGNSPLPNGENLKEKKESKWR